MELQGDGFDLVGKYNQGLLKGEQLKAFELKMLENPELALAVEEESLLWSFMMMGEIQDLKATTIKVHQKELVLRNIRIGAVTVGLLAFMLSVIYLVKSVNKAVPVNSPIKDSLKYSNKGFKSEIKETLKYSRGEVGQKVVECRNGEISKKLDGDAMINNKDLFVSGNSEVKIIGNEDVHIALPEKGMKNEEVVFENNRDIQKFKDAPIELEVKCDHVVVSAVFRVIPSCIDGTRGALILEQISGGVPPYVIHIFQDGRASNLQAQSLAEGNYSFEVYDKQGCASKKNEFEVTSRHCLGNFSINVAQGEVWEVPGSDVGGDIKIVDQSGILYFSGHIPFGQKLFWDGKGNNGQIKVGYFLYVLEQSNGQIQKGTITISE